MRGWAFYNDQNGTACSDPTRCQIIPGVGDRAAIGGGSAELATSVASDGNAIILKDYAGTRLDRITDLRYSTLRQTENAGNNLAIALQFNADFDLTDQSLQYQGRIVFEPYQGAGGNVPIATWQRWNAKTGKWWGTRSSVRRSDVLTTNACVQATPCTWAQLLTAFPNLGVHPTAGAVILKAGSGWPNFRGNVDSLTIAIDSVATTFDFEPSSALPVRLTVKVHPGVNGSWPVDSAYAPGTTVSYAVQAGPGRETPIVVLDDTLASTTGQIVMNGSRRLEVVSDTIYSYATLTALERLLADLNTQLLTAADKPAAMQAIIDFGLAEQRAGTTADALLRAAALADYVTVDPVRDSAALRRADEALAGWDFFTEYDESGVYYTYHLKVGAATSSLSVPSTTQASRSPNRPFSSARTRLAVETKSTRTVLTAPSTRVSNTATVSDPEDPQEATHIIYTNGIGTDRVKAGVTKSILDRLVYTQPRFDNYYTDVSLRYNPTWKVQMEEYDRTHPCVSDAKRDLSFKEKLTVLSQYAKCKIVNYTRTVTSLDLVEAITARVQLELGLPPTNDTVRELTDVIATSRSFNNHVLLVGHSEGTILQAQAIREFDNQDPRPLQVANRCVAAVALAPATTQATYGLDVHHLKGLLARNDIIRVVLPGSGWEEIDTRLSQDARAAIAASDEPEMTAIQFGLRIHDVDDTYLGSAGAPLFLGQLNTLHRECLPERARLALSTSSPPLGSVFTASLDIWNQNDRLLLGRPLRLASTEWSLENLDSLTFRAMTPGNGLISSRVTQDLVVEEPFNVPLVSVTFRIEERLAWAWESFAASNGPNGSWNPGPKPTDPWDGGESSCPRSLTVDGSSGDSQTWVLRCSRTYTPVITAPDTIASGRRVNRKAVYYAYASGVTEVGPTTYFYCAGSAPCIQSGYAEIFDERDFIIGRSEVVAPSQSLTSVIPTRGVDLANVMSLRTASDAPELMRSANAPGDEPKVQGSWSAWRPSLAPSGRAERREKSTDRVRGDQ